MFGQLRYQGINEPLNAAFKRNRTLVAVHRGTGQGTIAENTSTAVAAALAQGGDMVEIDVVQSTDGDYFLFHDGYEPMHFGIQENIRTLSTAQIKELHYKWCSHAGAPLPVAELGKVLHEHSAALFNVDRSWDYWPRLLPFLDTLPAPGRLLLKSPVQDDLLEQLSNHPVKYPYAPIVHSHGQVLRVLEARDVNTVGVELIAGTENHEFADPKYLRWLHSQGLFALLNAINLSNRVPLFAGWDDETSVLGSPEQGWGKLLSLGADIIQTDWPSLLVDYRGHLGRPARGTGEKAIR